MENPVRALARCIIIRGLKKMALGLYLYRWGWGPGAARASEASLVNTHQKKTSLLCLLNVVVPPLAQALVRLFRVLVPRRAAGPERTWPQPEERRLLVQETIELNGIRHQDGHFECLIHFLQGYVRSLGITKCFKWILLLVFLHIICSERTVSMIRITQELAINLWDTISSRHYIITIK